MLLDLPAQLRNILPAAGASCIVQLLNVALSLLALNGILCCCKLPMHTMTLLLTLKHVKKGNSQAYIQPLYYE